ncbi:MAG TPA: hypothetical protein VMR34_00195 [Candidatus Saccharimonadales bacterium]|nr:hypothetical protein [Candidatus Saccharimonadales bacterium]
MNKQKNLRRPASNSSGFTVVELLVIVLIIGILSSVLVLTYSGIQQKQHNNTRINDIKLIQTNLEAYFAQNGIYPTLTDINSNSWVQTNMKTLDLGSIRDPQEKSSIPAFSSVPIKTQYAYQPTASDGTSPCDNKTVACAKYVLTATLEGSTQTFVVKSLN